MIASRVVVIGLDAADFGFMRPWIDAGELPVLESLLEEGAHGGLRSTDPPVSAPAWATFMTGLRPGRHGLFDFVMEDPSTGRARLARADRIQGAKLWEVASRARKRSVVVNVPITWPPEKFDGVLVTGMLTPKGKTFTHPPELGAQILAELPGYRIEYDAGLLDDPPALRAHLDEVARNHALLMQYLLRREPWDLFVGIFTTPDRVKHQFWTRREEVVMAHYRLLDRAIGELLADVPADALVVVMSDHGFHSAPVRFYPNRWLREQGMLRVRRRRRESHRASDEDREIRLVRDFLAPERPAGGWREALLRRLGIGGPLEIDLARSRARLYSIETGGIQIQLRGRSPAGSVAPGAEYEALRDELIEKLRALRYPGGEEPLFDFVGRREEFYDGPMLEWAPDVVTRSAGHRVAIAQDLDPGKWLRASRHDPGGHSDTGILIARGPGVRRGARIDGARIEDLMPTLLWALGVAVPRDLDGAALTRLFDEETAAGHPVREGEASPPPGPARGDADEFSADEEAELLKTLEGLGYV